MFVYTLEHVIGGLVLLVIVGLYSYTHLRFRYYAWKGRKITERQRAREADKLKEEVDALRVQFPGYSDKTLEVMVRGNRMRVAIEKIQQRDRERNDNPDVRNRHTKGTIPQNDGREHFKAEGGFHNPLVVTSISDPLHVEINTDFGDLYQRQEATPEIKQQGKGNDESTGNDSSTRSFGHRADSDDRPSTQKGWQSERLEGGSGWGSESRSEDSGGSSSSSSSSDD